MSDQKIDGRTVLGIVSLVAVLAFFGFEIHAWVHAFMTCSGHVVKNWADFPVCVR